mmetsp:Transcript_29102/g.51146  ORF Transcript_29102/g.51146 Transcript_29102/m.51146 type:complete len:221 (+) Transcript_29102:195-857(+)|eukprot:CAMPEP_0197531958 /NCGR_PEP_ID=MMETSP1318-20131121/37974_1 /TAXON_ID=552666 /ORGANISM="Partenskyella glossopodia, Strain RCC365" /LENGTH=220 /DNA_ID=CAMNT_0043088369 /DNA_START=179 /DNA_END=841 /DNA_ORIENTATION=-
MTELKELNAKFSNLYIMEPTPYLRFLHAMIRDKSQDRGKFVFYTDQLLRLLCEYSFVAVPYKSKMVTTPTGNEFQGVDFDGIAGVSVMRSGEAMEAALRSVMLDIKVGKVLVQNDTETKERRLLYSKLPKDITKHHVMLLDPILASGTSALAVIKHLLEVGVTEEQITFVTMISCPEGIKNVLEAHPKISLVTSMVDDEINAQRILIPGIGEFSDRYFGT